MANYNSDRGGTTVNLWEFPKAVENLLFHPDKVHELGKEGRKVAVKVLVESCSQKNRKSLL